MSSIVIAGDTSGTITLSAPAVAGSNTISLPAVTGTILTTAYTGAVTFDGDFTVDTDTLHVDSTNNRVGIGKTNPTTALDVVGTVTATAFAGALTGNVTGDVSGNAGTVTNGVYTTDIGSTVQAYDADLTTLAGLSSADGNFIVGSATGWVVESGATARTSLGLGTAATTASTDYATAAQGTTADSALQPGDIGSTVQAYDADTTKNDVANTFTANQTINGDLTVDTNTLYVDSTNNRVGIGTASPSSITGTGLNQLVVGNTSGNNGVIVNCSSSGDTAYSFAVNNAKLGRVGYDYLNNMTFQTNNTERMRIDSSGNVGIGTSSPTQKLEVSGQVLCYDGLYVNKSTGNLGVEIGGGRSGDGASFIDLKGDTTWTDYGLRIHRTGGANSGGYIASRGTGPLELITIESGAYLGFKTSSTERMRIDSSGNVGIGTSSPGSKLDVSGTVTATAFSGDGSGLTGISAGAVLQAVYNNTDTRASYSAPNTNTPTEMTPLTTSITPTSSSSKVMIMVSMFAEGPQDVIYRLYRNSTLIGYNTATTSRWSGTAVNNYDGDNANTPFMVTFNYVDSPATTSAISYSVRCQSSNAINYTTYLNRCVNNAGADSTEIGMSCVTLLELA